MPTELLFDQMRGVILDDQRAAGGKLLANPEFLRFAHHWGVRIRACRPYRARTKGKVERPVRYVRDNFVYGREFLGDADLDAQRADWLERVANARLQVLACQQEELAGVPEKARATGAVDCVVRDLREEFVSDYVFPAIRGAAIYEGTYLLGTALARPLIAKAQVEVARETGCDAVAHGATGKGNDQVRFELTFRALAPELGVIAPWRDRNWDIRSRTDCIAYAQKYGIPVTATLRKPYSVDRNLMHVSYEGGVLEDPWRAPDEDMFLTTCSPDDLSATIFRQLGFPPDYAWAERSGRPVPLFRQGHVLDKLLA